MQCNGSIGDLNAEVHLSEDDRDGACTSDTLCVESSVDSSDDEPDEKTSVRFSAEVVLHMCFYSAWLHVRRCAFGGEAVIASAS